MDYLWLSLVRPHMGMDSGADEGGVLLSRDGAVEPESTALSGAVSATLWLRERVPEVAQQRQDHVETRLAAFRAAGLETSVRTWPACVIDCPDEEQSAAAEAFDRFRAVTGIRGVRVDPFFECRSNEDGSRTIRFPAACLALERDGDLTGLYPCHVDGAYLDIEDGLDAIAAGGGENLR